MPRRLLLGALLLTTLSFGAAASPETRVVVLKDGTRYTLSKPYEIRGSQARLQLANGPLVSIPASEIDVEATRLATPPPTPTPQPSAATPSSPAPKKGAFSVAGGTVLEGAYSGPTGDASTSASRPKTEHVSGYTRADGKYVAPYTRSAPSAPTKK